MLNEAVPLLAGIPNIPTSAVAMVALIGIPILIVAGLTQRRSRRAMIVAVLVALLGLVVWSFQNQNIDLAATLLAVVGFAVVVIAFVRWGAISAWSWIVGALAYQGLQGLRNAVYAPIWQERGAGALALVVASALIAVIARRAGRTRPSSGIFV
jgi:asparagine N-glycosylation enzyme membrane subunit Stt3